MTEQVDLFAAPAPSPPAQATTAPGELIFEIVPKGKVFAINWRCGEQSGVMGGLYADEAEAQRCIGYRLQLRAQGVKDHRPRMRTPPEGVRP